MTIEGRELADWSDRMNDAEVSLTNSVVKQTRAVVKQLFPQAKAKALHDEELNTSIQLNISLSLSKEPKAEVEGFVPPTIVACLKF